MTENPISCSACEIELTDYREGTLPAVRAAAIRAHLGACPVCAALFADVNTALAWVRALPQPEPPARMIAASLTQTLPPAPARVPQYRWSFAQLRASLFSPRAALGVAMAIFAFAFVLNAAQINLRTAFSPNALAQIAPDRLTAALERQAGRTWARGVSYYDDLRVVYEIEAAVHQMRQPQPAAGRDRSQDVPAAPQLRIPS